MTPSSIRPVLAVALTALCSCWVPAAAQDLSWSGFGTVGLAKSNREFTYQRYIDQRPGAERDTLFGAQADLRLNPQWSATVQLKLAPSLNQDNRWDLTPSWALVAWRPADDWLLRAGRMRAPLYLYSESMEVGQTYDMARMPTELYSLAPTTDIDGIALSKTWSLGSSGERELSADVISGSRDVSGRFWSRDGLPPDVQPGAQFKDILIKFNGLSLTLRQPDLVLRTSLHQVSTRLRSGSALPVRFPFVALPQLGPGVGYYQVNNSLPGPGVPEVGSIRNTILSLGAEIGVGGGWRVAAEYVRNRQHDTELGSDTRGSYVALLRQVGDWTPYVSVAQLGSRAAGFDIYRQLTNPTLPAFLPGAAQIGAAQRLAAESIWLADQRSLALGTSYALSPTIKLKGEWMRSWIGQSTRLIDTPAGSPTPHDTSVDVLSVNLNFAF